MVFQYTVDPYSQTFKLTLHHWLEPASYMRDNCIINCEPFLGGSALIFNAVESNIQLINILIYSNEFFRVGASEYAVIMVYISQEVG